MYRPTWTAVNSKAEAINKQPYIFDAESTKNNVVWSNDVSSTTPTTLTESCIVATEVVISAA